MIERGARPLATGCTNRNSVTAKGNARESEAPPDVRCGELRRADRLGPSGQEGSALVHEVATRVCALDTRTTCIALIESASGFTVSKLWISFAMRSSSNALSSTVSRWFILRRSMQCGPTAPYVSPSPAGSALRLHQLHAQPRAGRFGVAAQGGKGRRHAAALQSGDGRLGRAKAPGELGPCKLCCHAGARQRLDQGELVISLRVRLPEFRVLHQAFLEVFELRHGFTCFMRCLASVSAHCGVSATSSRKHAEPPPAGAIGSISVPRIEGTIR